MTLLSAATSGVRLSVLVALRDRLAADLDACGSARDVAALSQRLMDVLVQVEVIEAAAPKKKVTALDELANRRKAVGRANPKVQPRAKGTAK